MNDDTKIVPISEQNRKPPRAGMGRPKGAANKTTADVRQLILGALEEAGGQQWLARQASENPVAFMSLISKLLPKQLDIDANVTSEPITEIRRTIVDPQGDRHDR